MNMTGGRSVICILVDEVIPLVVAFESRPPIATSRQCHPLKKAKLRYMYFQSYQSPTYIHELGKQRLTTPDDYETNSHQHVIYYHRTGIHVLIIVTMYIFILTEASQT